MDILDTLSVPNPSATSVTAGLCGKFGTDGSIAVCGAGDAADGIIQYTTDGAATLLYDGILPVTAGGTITAGAEVVVDSNGKVIAAVPGSMVVGRYLGAASCALNDTIEIQFYRRRQYVYQAGGNEKIAVTHLTGAAVHGGVQAWTNPESGTIAIIKTQIIVNTVATGACQLDVGTTAVSNVTVSDNLLDGIDVHTATGAFGLADQLGANGLATQSLASGKWVTVKEASGDATGGDFYLVVTYASIP